MSASMLTAQQVQDLLDVDASTVYRMANDGRLPAVRIGRQWRFPADAIERMLVPTTNTATAPNAANAGFATAAAGRAGTGTTAASTRDTATMGSRTATTIADTAVSVAVLPPVTTTAVLEVVAPLLGVTMVVTDLGGRPVSAIVNPAPAIETRLDDPGFLDTCQIQWRGFAAEPHLAPRLQEADGGFLCAHALVRRGTALIAMVLAGGIAPGDESDLFHLDVDARREVLETLPRTAALLSRLATDGVAVPAER